MFLFIYYYFILPDIPTFVKDPKYPKEFTIIEKRIIEASEDWCNVFLDQKIERNAYIWKMFFSSYCIIK
jgi:hypothetical protein